MPEEPSLEKLNPQFPKTFNEEDFSKFVRENSKITWTITSTEFLQYAQKKTETDDDRKFLKSSVFPEDPKANFKWHLKLYPFDDENNNIQYSGFYLFLDYKKIPSPVYVAAYIYYEKNEVTKTFLLEDTFEDGSVGWGYSLMKSSKLQLKLFEGPFKLHAKVSAIYHRKTYAEETMQDNYLNLLENGSFSDVTFYTEDNTEFKVHMNILTVRSKGLATMLSNKMNENPTGKIVIENCSGATMKNVLRFIYCCKIEFLDVAETENLLDASEKYEIMGLKQQCLGYLSSVINSKNACSILLIAENFNLPNLKQSIFKLMQKNKRKFSSEAAYEFILEKKPRLLGEIAAKCFECGEFKQ